MKRIRVVFGKNVQFLRRFFGNSIERNGDLDIVDGIDDPVELLVFLRDVDVDVILLSMNHGGSSGLPSHLFAEYPFATLLVVNEDSRSAYIENLCPHRISIPDVSPDGVINALRFVTSQIDGICNEKTWGFNISTGSSGRPV